MPALFAALPESAPARRRSPANAVASVVLHAAAITLAVVATAKAGPHGPPRPEEHPDVIWVPQPPPTPAPVERREVGRRADDGRAGAPARDHAPDVPSTPIPNFDPTMLPEPTVPTGEIGETWRTRGNATDGGPSAGGPGTGEVFTGPQVERAAALRGPVTPRYPAMLRERGIEGRVTLRFVVDTTGRVEPASVIVVSSTHELFAASARAALPALRFSPAEAAGGRRVRQLVELPFTFELR